MWIWLGTAREAHVDDEPHPQVAQSVVIVDGGGVADEEIISDLREIHAGNRIIKIFVKEPYLPHTYSSTMIFPCVPSTRILCPSFNRMVA